MHSIRAALFGFLLLGGCARHSPPPAQAEADQAPHGGTVVTLGTDAYHVELVRDAESGRLDAYILDGEMENFLRLPLPYFRIVASVGGEKRPLDLQAAANPATGETVGNTAQFTTQADWLKSTPNFDAVLESIEIEGHAYKDVAFAFPKGNGGD